MNNITGCLLLEFIAQLSASKTLNWKHKQGIICRNKIINFLQFQLCFSSNLRDKNNMVRHYNNRHFYTCTVLRFTQLIHFVNVTFFLSCVLHCQTNQRFGVFAGVTIGLNHRTCTAVRNVSSKFQRIFWNRKNKSAFIYDSGKFWLEELVYFKRF